MGKLAHCFHWHNNPNGNECHRPFLRSASAELPSDPPEEAANERLSRSRKADASTNAVMSGKRMAEITGKGGGKANGSLWSSRWWCVPRPLADGFMIVKAAYPTAGYMLLQAAVYDLLQGEDSDQESLTP